MDWETSPCQADVSRDDNGCTVAAAAAAAAEVQLDETELASLVVENDLRGSHLTGGTSILRAGCLWSGAVCGQQRRCS